MDLATGSFNLIIRGKHDLDFDEIEKNLGLEATSKKRKGTIISKVMGPIPNDIWIFEIEYNENSEPKEVFGSLITRLKPTKDYLAQLSTLHDVCLRFYIQSDFAQIFFRLSPQILNDLAELNLPLEVSILSWGGVEDND